jgi:hypothetical protein
MMIILDGRYYYSEDEAVTAALKNAYASDFGAEVRVFLATLEDYGYKLVQIEVE